MLREESERDQLIANAIQVGMGYEKTQSLLEKEYMPKLYARDRRDTIFIWAYPEIWRLFRQDQESRFRLVQIPLADYLMYILRKCI